MTPILHHYPASPFAELVRMALGLKGLAWQSVIIPRIAPKPDLAVLTGGYIRTPVLQIGADIYCDTAAILSALEAYAPEPSFTPVPLAMLHIVVANWAAGPQFRAHVGAAMGAMPEGALDSAFLADRKARFGLDISQLGKAAPQLAAQTRVAALWLSQTLADGRAFIGGDAPGHGDLALAANVWFVRSVPFSKANAEALTGLPHVADWFARMEAIGHGTPSEISADEAIGIAHAATPGAVDGSIEAPFSAGQTVGIQTEGSGDAPVEGALLKADSTGISICRTDPRTGDVNIHFPRIGQFILG
jgi:glutathione S-transferase